MLFSFSVCAYIEVAMSTRRKYVERLAIGDTNAPKQSLGAFVNGQMSLAAPV